MLSTDFIAYDYQVGGSLPLRAPSHVRRQADEDLFRASLKGEFCYVLNARQMGKSSLRVRTLSRLQSAGIRCGVLDITTIGTLVTSEQWYASIISSLVNSFQLSLDIQSWWRDRQHLTVIDRLSKFIDTVLLKQVEQGIVIFIDEIDSILGLQFSADDLFALIRACYNKRADDENYQRLSFVVIGVATPSDLINDKIWTPFHIGKAIHLQGFCFSEAVPLLSGLSGVVQRPEVVLQEILRWTRGQPFLTQKLCRLIVQEQRWRKLNEITGWQNRETLPPAQLVHRLIQKHILENWEAQDEPEHLKTIRDRLLRSEKRAGRVLSTYQQILEAGSLEVDDSSEQVELLLSGLVEKHQGVLRVKNPIYETVFDLSWVEKQQKGLCPYAAALHQWLSSKLTDESRLLRGQALLDAQFWSRDKSLSDLDYQFLAASQDFDRQEMQKVREAEPTLDTEIRLLQERRNNYRQRVLLVLISAALLFSLFLGMTTYYQYQQALISAV